MEHKPKTGNRNALKIMSSFTDTETLDTVGKDLLPTDVEPVLRPGGSEQE